MTEASLGQESLEKEMVALEVAFYGASLGQAVWGKWCGD